MVDDVKDITEKAESKEALDRARLARERREAEQRKRLDELRAHAAAAQAQREKRDEERRKRQAEQRARDDDRRVQKRDEELCQRQLGQHAKDDDRRLQVEERKRAIWEASISRREALLQRERDRTERLERARAARSSPRPAFAFGSSTPRLLEPVDSAGFFWAARSTNPIDQMNFFESLAASTTNVMFASAPLTRRASALQLDSSDTDNKDEPDRSPRQVWSSVARRRTDLVPTLPAPRAPGRAYSMTRLDRIAAARPLHAASASPSMHHLHVPHHRTQTRSGETTPGSRPGSAMSNATGVVRRASSAPRKPRPASIAGTGVNTPRGPDTGANSVATTPSVSRDATTVVSRPATTPRRPRPLSLHAPSKPATPVAPGEGKPPLHRKPKPSKDHDKSRGKSLSASPGRALSPSPVATKEPSIDKEIPKSVPQPVLGKSQVNAIEVTQKLEALRIDDRQQTSEIKEPIEVKPETNNEQKVEDKPIDVQKPVEKVTEDIQKVVEKVTEEKQKPVEKVTEDKREEKKELSVEKTEENEMTASMVRRITTEEEAKAALAERRRRAREELEKQAELERQRLQREAEEEAERQRQEEERQRREEEEARELAALQRKMEEEKLRKAIEAQQQLEKEEAERRVREEEERKLKAKEEEERRKAADEAEKLKREEAEKEERERLARKQRVEAIMARTRLKKQAEEDKKQQEMKAQQQQNQTAPENNTSAIDATAAKDSVDSATPNVTGATNNTTNENGATNNTTNENRATNNTLNESVALGIKTESVESGTLVNTVQESETPLVNFAQDSAKSESVSLFSDGSAKSESVSLFSDGSAKSESVSLYNDGSAKSENVLLLSDGSAKSESVSLYNDGSAKTESVSLFSDDSVKSDAIVGSLESASSVSDSASIVTVREGVNVNLPVSVDIGVDNSNGNMQSADLLQLAPSQPEDTTSQSAPAVTNNGNVTADLLGLSQQHETKDKPEEQTTKQVDNTPTLDANNGNPNVGHISASFIQSERSAELANKLDNKLDEFATHNGHNHPLTLRNAI